MSRNPTPTNLEEFRTQLEALLRLNLPSAEVNVRMDMGPARFYKLIKEAYPNCIGLEDVAKFLGIAWRTPRKNLSKQCTIGDCTRKYAARGMCGHHYQKWRTYGDANHAGKGKGHRTDLDESDNTPPITSEQVEALKRDIETTFTGIHDKSLPKYAAPIVIWTKEELAKRRY